MKNGGAMDRVEFVGDIHRKSYSERVGAMMIMKPLASDMISGLATVRGLDTDLKRFQGGASPV